MEQALYELPEGWETVKLGSICNLLNGYAFKAKEYVHQSDTVIIRMGNIRPNGSFDIEHKIKYLPEKYADELPGYILHDGDLIIAMTDMASSMKILGIPTIVSNSNGRTLMLNQRVGKLYDFDFGKIKIGFLKYILSTNHVREHYKGLGGGGLQINIGKQQILSVLIPLPPINEQKLIVTKLDALFSRIDTAITHLQQTLELTKALFASALKVEVSGDGNDWPYFPLNSIGEFLGGGTPAKSKPDYWDGEIPWITPKDMKSPELSNSEMKITPLGVDQSSAKMLPVNSVLIVARSGILRHTLPVCVNRVEATVNQDIKVFIPGKRVTPEYIQYLLKGNESFILRQLVKGGVTVESLKYKEFQSHSFPIPDSNEQNRIVAHLDALSERTCALEAATQEKINDLTILKASLLDAAFKGQL